MFTFRTSITVALMTFITALAGLLIFVQVLTFRLAAKEAASARMDSASTEMLGRMRNEISGVTSVVDVLSSSSSVADSDERSEVGCAIPLFRSALDEVPQMESVDVGYGNGGWLQVRPLGYLNGELRARLRAPKALTLSSIRCVQPRKVSCPCAAYSRTCRTTSSSNSTYESMVTIRASASGTTTR